MHTMRHFIGILGLILLLAAPTALRAVDPEPFTLPISFSFTLTAGSGNAITTVYDATSPSIEHFTSGGAESDVGMARLKPGRQYDLLFQASGIAEYWIGLTPPNGYQFYVNGVPKDLITRTPGGGEYNDWYKIELRPINGAGFLPAGSFSGIQIGQAVTWELGLGGARAGHSVGRVGFRELDLSNSPSARARLLYVPPINTTQVNIITESPTDLRIRQIVSPRNMVDFVDDGEGGYWVRYYNYDDTTWVPAVPIYTINAGDAPWRTIHVQSPAANQLKITEKENQTGATERISYLKLDSGSVTSGTYKWILQEGGPSDNWLRTTTHDSVKSGSTRENIVTVRTGGTTGTIVSETKYVYHTYAWGEDLYQVVANPNGTSDQRITTTYEYYETAPSPGSETHRGNYRRVKSVTGSGGEWTAYEYYDDWNQRGQLKYEFHPFQDSPSSPTFNASQGRVKYFTYALDPSLRYRRPAMIQEKINNYETAKTEWTYDNSANSGLLRLKADVKTYDRTNHYVSTRTESIEPFTADIDQAGEPYVVKNPDHTQVSWSRASGDYNPSTHAFTVPGTDGYYWRILKLNGTTVATGAEAQTSYNGQSFESIYLIANKSTMEVTILDYAGVSLRTETRIYTGSGAWSAVIGAVDYAYDFELTNRLTSRTASDGTATSYAYNADGNVGSITATSGVVTEYTYDDLDRTATAKKLFVSASGIHAAQSDLTTTYTYDGANRVTAETVSTSGVIETIVSAKGYDKASRVTSVTPPGLSATSIVHNAPNRTQTTTAPSPDNGTTIRESWPDGRLKSVTGTGVVPAYYTYFVETDGRLKTQVNFGFPTSPRVQYAWTDWLGRSIKTQKPGFSQSSQIAYVEEQSFDDTTGQLVRTTRTGYAPTRYAYDTLGRVIRSGLDVNDNGLVIASNDRITEADTVFELNGGTWWFKTTSTTYPDAGAATHPITTTNRQRLTGLSTNLLSETQATDAEGNTVTTVSSISGKLHTTRTTVPGLTAGDRYDYVYNGLASATTGHDGLTTKLAYDALGRLWQKTDPRGNVVTTAYHTGTALAYTMTDDASPANTLTTIGYDTSGRTSWTADADARITHYAYNQRGQVTRQWGTGAYPVSYTYDATYGDRTGMSTYRDAADDDNWPSAATADTTSWIFDTASGLLWKKSDAKGEVVEMNYNARGQVSKRTLARGVYTEYAYSDITGELTGRTYSDDTPDVAFTYTRLGQTSEVTDVATGSWEYVYDPDKPWRLGATMLPGFYGTRVQTPLYESSGAIGRYKGFQLGSDVGYYEDLEQSYTYATDGRFDTLISKRSNNNVASTFDYSYVANTPFVEGYTVSDMSNFSVMRTYESKRDLLATVNSRWGTDAITRYDYTYDARYFRQTAKQSGSAFSDYYVGGYTAVYNHYTYNARGELETAAMYGNNTPSATPSSSDELPGRRFEYRYDSIGNRKHAGPTGDSDNIDEAYIPNELNQYVRKENNTVRVLGTAATAATGVLVRGATTGRKDRAWAADLVPPNETTAFKGTATVIAADPGGGIPSGDLVRLGTATYFVPKWDQAFEYDVDGNLTNNSVWSYSYDAENRLIGMEHRAEVIGMGMIAAADARKLVFVYDYLGRRVRKTTYDGWNGSSYSTIKLTDTKYLYDGWNLVAEFDVDETMTLLRVYTWGLDLTGSLTGAGGIGGLLQIYDAGVSKTLLPTYDGNGNVAAMVNATNSTLILEAVYEYDPYGNLLRKEGAYAAENPIRFSTRYTDGESDLVYFGRRFYSTALGRFINRDPIEEQGGVNLYSLVQNNAINKWDYIGLGPEDLEPDYYDDIQGDRGSARESHGNHNAFGGGDDLSGMFFALAEAQHLADVACP